MEFEKNQKTVLITGSAGFIGYHISKLLLDEGFCVIGIDSMSDYYDVSLKRHREEILLKSMSYKSIHAHIENPGVLLSLFETEKPEVVIHLAAQAGVRYSISNPREYLETNIIGTFELLEAARKHPPKHMLIASTSSAYGANDQMPYKETDPADHQMSFYAATKKSTENMAHSYAHLYNIPITMFRFFTVYGPLGRPDMALFKFTKAILEGKTIDVYNHGNMKRDFTYIDDLVISINLLINTIPGQNILDVTRSLSIDSKSPVAPYRVVNIGNSNIIKLTEFIQAIEDALGMIAVKNMLPMQSGDVPETWADVSLLKTLTNYTPDTNIKIGVRNFVNWYRDYYKV
jgi:UDP-glucuronate 4-epimerase